MNWKTCFLPLLLAAAVLGSVTAFADGEPAAPPAVQNEAQTALAPGDTITTEENLTYTVNDDGQTVTLTDGSSATGSITIPAAVEQDGTSYPVTSVVDFAFQYCGALESVTFSGDVGSIGGFAFENCWQLESVTFSGDVGSIGYGAFRNCDALESVTFSGNVGSIGDTVFGFCTALESVTFPGDVGNIENNAFERCSALTTLTFSGDVGNIEGFAFGDCTALTTIYVPVSTTEDTIDMIRTALNSSGLPGVKIERSAPEQPSDPATDPSTPSAPSTGTTGSASTAVQQLEAAERPDPMDVEATERYNFWMDVKSDLRAAENGEKVRVHVPSDYTNMPASVMETIRTLGKEITIDLRWNGQRLIITPQTALRRPARKAFWTLSQLCEEYAR